MAEYLKKYNSKRNFKKTSEPIGKKDISKNKLKFCVQHHLARKDHYDFRLELDGVLLSWAVPKGPSYNIKDKRLAVHVEDHPLSYRRFEGVIPAGEYGGGTVMLFDEGYWIPINDPKTGYKNGTLKFILKGKRLKGKWTLVHFKENNWLLIKDEDEYHEFNDIYEFNKSIKTGRTMEEIANNIKKTKASKKLSLKDFNITNPDKIISKKGNITKLDVLKYYEAVQQRMLPFIQNRIISVKRCPNGIHGNIFFKKHLETESKGLKKLILDTKNTKNDYYYITNSYGLLDEARMNTIEFHPWGSLINHLNNPDIMVFDLDPDESMSLDVIRTGVKDLKKILDEYHLKSYLKTSGGKGYHVVVPFKSKMSWDEFRSIAKNIALLMETKYPDKYTSNIRKAKRKGKIFIDWVRNTKGATSVAPYSLRARDYLPVSMPIKWSELDKIAPNEIKIFDAIKRLKRKDPWADFFN